MDVNISELLIEIEGPLDMLIQKALPNGFTDSGVLLLS
jgi:hypothetical protein